MKEYLATLDDAAFGAASDVTPKFVSPSPVDLRDARTHRTLLVGVRDNQAGINRKSFAADKPRRDARLRLTSEIAEISMH